MQKPEIPTNESDRLVALDRYKILDTLPEQVYDDLTQLAADICGTPIALISLVDKDRQWFKSRVGIDATETPRDISFCGHAVAANAILNVPDASLDPRFADNPLVTKAPKIRFYAGVPLITDDNFALGTLCVIDRQPHDLTEQQIRQLEALSRLVISQLELRLKEESLRILASVVESSVDAIITKTVEGIITSWNPAAERLFGYSEAEAIGQPISMLIPPDRLDEEPQIVARIMREERVENFETVLTSKEGKRTEVSATIFPLVNEAVQVVGASSILRDISDRKQAEKALEESQRLLQAVLDCLPLAVFWKDRQSALLGCNQVFATVTGLTSPREAVGKSNSDFSFSEEEKLKYILDDQEVMESGVAKIGIQETITLPNGNISWLETNKTPLIDSLGEVVGVVCTFQDISDRKFAEEALAESEAFNRQLIKEFPIGLASCRMDGQLVYVNSAFAKILGRTIEETLELTYWDITPIKYAEQEAAQLESLQIEGRYGSYEKEYIHKDGHLVPVLLNGLAIAQKGELIIWSSVQDISDRKQAEQIILQQANRETLLRGITQRIRQSLDLSIIFDTACQEIQQLLQCDRVGIFKFYPESNFNDGEFVAESVVDGFSSAKEVPIHDHCFGENYAAAYAKGRIQVVNDIDNADLTDCHRDILAQFQVRANLVIPLLCGNNLWGLLCIHQCAHTRQWQEHEVNLIQQIAIQLAIAIQQASLYEQLQEDLLIRQQSQSKIAQQLREQQTLATITNK
ncbi:MAG: PAS domain S-box protein, partial [Pseudanabaena sp.]